MCFTNHHVQYIGHKYNTQPHWAYMSLNARYILYMDIEVTAESRTGSAYYYAEDVRHSARAQFSY